MNDRSSLPYTNILDSLEYNSESNSVTMNDKLEDIISMSSGSLRYFSLGEESGKLDLNLLLKDLKEYSTQFDNHYQVSSFMKDKIFHYATSDLGIQKEEAREFKEKAFIELFSYFNKTNNILEPSEPPEKKYNYEDKNQKNFSEEISQGVNAVNAILGEAKKFNKGIKYSTAGLGIIGLLTLGYCSMGEKDLDAPIKQNTTQPNQEIVENQEISNKELQREIINNSETKAIQKEVVSTRVLPNKREKIAEIEWENKHLIKGNKEGVEYTMGCDWGADVCFIYSENKQNEKLYVGKTSVNGFAPNLINIIENSTDNMFNQKDLCTLFSRLPEKSQVEGFFGYKLDFNSKFDEEEFYKRECFRSN